MRRYLVTIAAVAMIAAGCANTLGRSVPECDRGTGTLVLAVQSVPTSDYISCVEGLKAGWEYEDLEAKSGQSSYTLDSDRMGQSFVRIDNVESCDVGEATLVDTDDRGIELWKDIDAELEVEIAVVPEGPTTATSARVVDIVLQLQDQELRGRPIVVTPLVEDEPTAARIEAAASTGAYVIVISIRDAEEGTVTLLMSGASVEVEVDSLSDALEMIEGAVPKPYYSGNWFYVFDRGCVTYTFDAEGPGVSSIEDDIEIALSLFDAEEFRQIARDAGYRLP
ncbi:MAG: hypothetical protein ACR2NG_01035 [Acidimicrobiia bacterium]